MSTVTFAPYQYGAPSHTIMVDCIERWHSEISFERNCTRIVLKTGGSILVGNSLEQVEGMVKAALQPLANVSQWPAWQPMRMAPRDGTPVLLLLNGSDIPHAARWLSGPDDPRATDETTKPGWYFTWDGSQVTEYDGPTYWIPLPPGETAQPADSSAHQPNRRPPQATAVGAGIEMNVGAYVLCHAAAFHPDFWDGESGPDVPNIKITDPALFTREVAAAINREDEDGSTLLTRMLDEAVRDAVESGCEGVDHA